jgi:DNA-binding transcriptional LysR family regulator
MRTTRSVNLTEAGRRFYERVAPALRETEAAVTRPPVRATRSRAPCA